MSAILNVIFQWVVYFICDVLNLTLTAYFNNFNVQGSKSLNETL